MNPVFVRENYFGSTLNINAKSRKKSKKIHFLVVFVPPPLTIFTFTFHYFGMIKVVDMHGAFRINKDGRQNM